MEVCHMHFTLEQVALELVKIEKNNPSVGMPESTISLYEDYVKKVYDAKANYNLSSS